MMNARGLLPIGSVVLLNEGQKRLMIFGVKQTDGDDIENIDESAPTYDYSGVLYPEGNVGIQHQYFFNHEDIAEVFFRGFEDEERAEFIERLADFYAQQN